MHDERSNSAALGGAGLLIAAALAVVALHSALAAERFAHDQSLEMLSVAHDPYPGALKPLFDMALDLLRSDHQCLNLYPSRSSARVRRDASPRKAMTAKDQLDAD